MNASWGRWTVRLCCLVGAWVGCSQLEAKLITYEFSGTVEIIWTDGPVRGSVPPEIQFPLFDDTSTWSATITLDDDESAYDETRTGARGLTGYISSPGPPMDITVNLNFAGGGGAHTFSAPAIGDLEFWIGNDIEDMPSPLDPNTTIPGGDLVTISSWVRSGLDDVPWDRQSMTLFLRDSTATALSDELIPESLDIANFDDNIFNISFTTAEGLALQHLQLFVDDVSLVEIPEASAVLLAMFAGLTLVSQRDDRRRYGRLL